MYALCVSGAVNTQGFVLKFFYSLYIYIFFLLIHLREVKSFFIPTCHCIFEHRARAKN